MSGVCGAVFPRYNAQRKLPSASLRATISSLSSVRLIVNRRPPAIETVAMPSPRPWDTDPRRGRRARGGSSYRREPELAAFGEEQAGLADLARDLHRNHEQPGAPVKSVLASTWLPSVRLSRCGGLGRNWEMAASRGRLTPSPEELGGDAC